jgi:hypothetical protein
VHNRPVSHLAAQRDLQLRRAESALGLLCLHQVLNTRTVRRQVVRADQRAPRLVIVTAPGQEAQVDYGTGPIVRDPETRKYR